VVLSKVHDFFSVVTVVGSIGGAVIVVCLREDKNVFAPTEGIFEDGYRMEVDVRVMPRGLIGGGAIEIPDTQLPDVCHRAIDGLIKEA
jgi:hypothetical protein